MNLNSAIDAPNRLENWWGARVGIDRISSRTRYWAALMSASSKLCVEPKAQISCASISTLRQKERDEAICF
jgi:hypothetical protein